MKVNLYGTDYQIVQITCEKYYDNNNLAIQLMCKDNEYGIVEPFATLTVNLCKLSKKNLAFIDTNNCPWAVDFIAEYNLGKDTGMTRQSGYCVYPLYEMNLKELDKYKEVNA